MKPRTGLYLVIAASFLVLVSCGTSTPTYSIGGTVVNLAAGSDGVQLYRNDGEKVTVTANGTFTFPTKVTRGTYSVTIGAQPSAPAQICGVTNGSGTADADVTNVAVDCAHNEWKWMSGANVGNRWYQAGTYGTKGTPAPDNVPGARESLATWTDTSGSLWLFGGDGPDPVWSMLFLNDLWKYSGGEWTWMSGANVPNQAGTYGTKGTPAPDNTPGARNGAVSWTDTSGNLWFFGGFGYDSTPSPSQNSWFLNDLWRYSGGEWTWMSGANVSGQVGTYGAKGTPAPDNVPGARYGAVSWTDTSGNLWLFGGYGYDSTGFPNDGSELLNDLWKYSGGEWAWMSGAKVRGQVGTYGTKGTPAPDNTPGARFAAVSWTDTSGNLWLFGGFGYDSVGKLYFNDLWKYSGGEWTWMSGASVSGQAGTYGTERTPAPGNVPGARIYSVTWTDTNGNLWLFGGLGYDSGGQLGHFNDLWKYSGGEWTWMSGANVSDQAGTYGTKGTPAPGNVPGARTYSATWTDTSGNFWLFGGEGSDSQGNWGMLNDLWMYEP